MANKSSNEKEGPNKSGVEISENHFPHVLQLASLDIWMALFESLKTYPFAAEHGIVLVQIT